MNIFTMSIRTGAGVLLAVACGTSLVACGATESKGPDVTVTTPSVGRPAPPDSVQAALSRMAFTPYAALGESANDGLAPQESSFTLGQSCTSVAGYPDADADLPLAVPISAAGMAFAQDWGAWGYLGAADAGQYGFLGLVGRAMSQLGLGAQPVTSPDPTTLPRAEQTALGKCETVMQDFSTSVDSGALAGVAAMGAAISTDVAQDTEVKNATKAWDACMTRNGYHVTDPRTAGRDALASTIHAGTGGTGGKVAVVGGTVSAAANEAQIAMAVTDANCTRSSDLAGIYFAVQASYEQQIVTANQQALTAAVQRYRAAYASEVKKLPRLLRTATAQPVGKARFPGVKQAGA